MIVLLYEKLNVGLMELKFQNMEKTSEFVTSLSLFEKILIKSQLKNCLSQMKLLSSISSENKARQFKSKVISSIPATQSQMMLKLIEERIFIEKTLDSTFNEINATNSCGEHLKSIIEQLGSQNKEQCGALSKSIEQMKIDYLSLEKQMNDILAETDSQMKKMDIDASAVKDELENSSFQQEIELKYTEKWETARAEQNLTIAKIEETRLTKKLAELQNQINFEDRVHTEITLFLEQTTLKFEEDIKTWEKKYIEQMAYYDKELLDIKEKREIQLDKLNNLTIKFHDHARKIKEYTFEKEERIRESALKEHLNKTTTKIQAWWRGVMVRRHLGPFKKKGKAKERPKFKGKAGEKGEQEPKGKPIKK